MARSQVTLDLGAIRRNARTLLRVLDGAELWAVVKADGYGHGAADVGRRRSKPARPRSASRPCRRRWRSGRRSVPVRLVLGPDDGGGDGAAREAGLELVVAQGAIPEGVPCT